MSIGPLVSRGPGVVSDVAKDTRLVSRGEYSTGFTCGAGRSGTAELLRYGRNDWLRAGGGVGLHAGDSAPML